MSTPSEYKFIDEPLPQRLGRPKATVYGEIVRDFVASEFESRRIELEGRTPSTLYQQLLKAVKTAEAPIKVHKSGDGVWLVKAE